MDSVNKNGRGGELCLSKYLVFFLLFNSWGGGVKIQCSLKCMKKFVCTLSIVFFWTGKVMTPESPLLARRRIGRAPLTRGEFWLAENVWLAESPDWLSFKSKQLHKIRLSWLDIYLTYFSGPWGKIHVKGKTHKSVWQCKQKYSFDLFSWILPRSFHPQWRGNPRNKKFTW